MPWHSSAVMISNALVALTLTHCGLRLGHSRIRVIMSTVDDLHMFGRSVAASLAASLCLAFQKFANQCPIVLELFVWQMLIAPIQFKRGHPYWNAGTDSLLKFPRNLALKKLFSLSVAFTLLRIVVLSNLSLLILYDACWHTAFRWQMLRNFACSPG